MIKSGKIIIDIVKNLTGDAMPYLNNKNNYEQLPDEENISYNDMSKSKILELYMMERNIKKKDKPYDLIYAEEFCNFIKILTDLHPRGKIVISCKKENSKNIVKQAHKSNLFWCEHIQQDKFTLLVFRKVRVPERRWSGEKQGNIFIYSEHGWGDIFHKLRYLDYISKNFKGRKILEARSGIENLFKHCFPEFEIVKKGEPYPEGFYEAELCEIDKIIGEDVGQNAKIPYINLNYSKKFNAKKKIGVCWEGHRLTFNSQRNFNPYLFKNLAKKNDIYCVQKFLNPNNVVPEFIKQPTINDWLDTARLIHSMDFIISIDTSIGHLSGAMGKNTKIMLHKNSYYTPFKKIPSWYPTISLHQKETWEKTIESINIEILNNYKFKIL